MPHVVIVADGRFTRQSSILIRSIHAAIRARNFLQFWIIPAQCVRRQQFRYASIDLLILNQSRG
jgi:hypothetical protein